MIIKRITTIEALMSGVLMAAPVLFSSGSDKAVLVQDTSGNDGALGQSDFVADKGWQKREFDSPPSDNSHRVASAPSMDILR